MLSKQILSIRDLSAEFKTIPGFLFVSAQKCAVLRLCNMIEV